MRITRSRAANGVVQSRVGRWIKPSPKYSPIKTRQSITKVTMPPPKSKARARRKEESPPLSDEILSGKRQLVVNVERMDVSKMTSKKNEQASSKVRSKQNEQAQLSSEEGVRRGSRVRKVPKYLQEIAETSEVSVTERVPVYNQKATGPKRTKKDVYAFDEHEERASSESDNEYDKDMDQDMKAIEMLIRQQKKKALITNKRTDVQKPARAQIILKEVLTHKNKRELNIKQHRFQIEQHNDNPSPREQAHQSYLDITYRTFIQPMANSTIIQDVTRVKTQRADAPSTSTPSRLSLYRPNGPLVLQTKPSGLPSFEQDLVVTASHDIQKSSVTLNKTPPQNAATPRSTRQTNLDSFVTGAQPIEEPLECTLFDEGLLISPVKTPMPLRDCTNLVHTVSPSISAFHMFDEPVVPRSIVGKPTRLPEFAPAAKRAILRKPTHNNSRAESVLDAVPESQEQDNTPPQELNKSEEKSQLKVEEEDRSIVGIFEDFQEPLAQTSTPNHTYARKRKHVKFTKHVEDDDESEDEDVEKKRKRPKKNEMNKQEKQKFTKWVREFNSMCHEISQHELDVE